MFLPGGVWEGTFHVLLFPLILFLLFDSVVSLHILLRRSQLCWHAGPYNGLTENCVREGEMRSQRQTERERDEERKEQKRRRNANPEKQSLSEGNWDNLPRITNEPAMGFSEKNFHWLEGTHVRPTCCQISLCLPRSCCSYYIVVIKIIIMDHRFKEEDETQQ